jgi:chorismate-pyruvate lyase
MKAQATEEQHIEPDVNKAFSHNHIEPSNLSPFQRVLLTTDGTLTEILEAYLQETIRVIKLSEFIISTTQDILPLKIFSGNNVIERKVLLQGKISKKIFIYAESIIVLDRLDEKFKDELLKSQIPIGRLWLENKMETFKEIIDLRQESAENFSDYFHLNKGETMFSRTYRVFSNHQPIMMITEKFPGNHFKKEL